MTGTPCRIQGRRDVRPGRSCGPDTRGSSEENGSWIRGARQSRATPATAPSGRHRRSGRQTSCRTLSVTRYSPRLESWALRAAGASRRMERPDPGRPPMADSAPRSAAIRIRTGCRLDAGCASRPQCTAIADEGNIQPTWSGHWIINLRRRTHSQDRQHPPTIIRFSRGRCRTDAPGRDFRRPDLRDNRCR